MKMLMSRLQTPVGENGRSTPDECSSQDYTFTMTASGTYNFRFHVIDMNSGVYYLRTNTYIQLSDEK